MKNQYKNIIPLAIMLLILTASYSFASSGGLEEGTFPQMTSNSGIASLRPLEEAEEDGHICGLSSVKCSFEADDSVIAVKHGGENPSFKAGLPVSGHIKAIISFYSEIDSCHTGVSCLMANGKKAQIGYLACPRRYKLGTKVRIDGKVYECGDRTAKWVDGRWDIFTGYNMDAYNKAIKYGIQTKLVEILDD